ncbi:MAG: hypothetical protein PHG00_18240, partial [Methylococcales bacterium]|nr:hypothetical protein [Methylococcales bacterium]
GVNLFIQSHWLVYELTKSSILLDTTHLCEVHKYSFKKCTVVKVSIAVWLRSKDAVVRVEFCTTLAARGGRNSVTPLSAGRQPERTDSGAGYFILGRLG